jgi:hypothetical protein
MICLNLDELEFVILSERRFSFVGLSRKEIEERVDKIVGYTVAILYADPVALIRCRNFKKGDETLVKKTDE